jgi:hypothetical protein
MSEEIQMDYWVRPEFAAAIQAIPTFQLDASGNKIAKVNVRLYKMFDGQLVCAMIPEDLSMPSLWHPSDIQDINSAKAKSMLGAT